MWPTPANLKMVLFSLTMNEYFSSRPDAGTSDVLDRQVPALYVSTPLLGASRSLGGTVVFEGVATDNEGFDGTSSHSR